MQICLTISDFWEGFLKLIASDVSAQIFATFLGALLAYFFGLKLYKLQKRQENIATLHFFISGLTSLSNNLYALKEQIVQHRYQECLKCKKILKTEEQPNLQIKHMSTYIYTDHFEWPIAKEKLEFISSPDPNVIVLAGVLNGSIKTLNAMVNDINTDVNGFIKGKDQFDPNALFMMITKNELLYEQLDSTLYLTKKLLDVLIKFGAVKFGKNMKIKTIELTHDKYKNIPPKPIESWEEYEWFPKKGLRESLIKKIKSCRIRHLLKINSKRGA